MSDLYDLLSQVAPFVVDCPEGVQAWALRKAAARFTGDCHLWRATLTAVTGVSGGYIPLSEFTGMPDNTARIATLAVRMDGQDYRYGWAMSGDMLCLKIAPASGSSVEMDVVLRATEAATQIPDDLAAKYGGAVADLAIHLIQSVPARPYTDPAGAAQALARYLDGLHRANVDRLTGGRAGVAALTNPMPDYF